MTTKLEPIKDIPANPNSIEVGEGYDPQPEKGPAGAKRREFWSWVKGFFVK